MCVCCRHSRRRWELRAKYERGRNWRAPWSTASWPSHASRRRRIGPRAVGVRGMPGRGNLGGPMRHGVRRPGRLQLEGIGLWLDRRLFPACRRPWRINQTSSRRSAGICGPRQSRTSICLPPDAPTSRVTPRGPSLVPSRVALDPEQQSSRAAEQQSSTASGAVVS